MEIENDIQNTKDEKDTVDNKKIKNKMKNLISIIILLLGMFIGSLFVDFSQLIRRDGFSNKKLNQSDIFEADKKTWVAYSEPVVNVAVVNDDGCENCKVDEILVWLKRILPTLATKKIAYNSEEGKQLIQKFSIKTLPAFVFGSEVKQTDFYSQAGTLFDEKDNQLALRTQDVGIPAGKYVELPKINDGDAVFGYNEAKVRVVIFSDFQCPYCKLFQSNLRDIMKNYQDKVIFDYKFLPLDIHTQANDAALAAGCALEQNKFWEYADKLYANQTVWSTKDDLPKFKEYAKMLGLDVVKFNQCLVDKKYQTKIDADKKEADSFAISETPSIFVDDQFQSGTISADQLKSAIDKELAK
jgi:protein-disulfide isomerase